MYSTILRYDTPAAEIAELNPKGIILSGGPSSVYAKDAPLPDKAIFELGVPVLGICYGVQLLAHFLGGKVEKGQNREYGKGTLIGPRRLVRALRRAAQVAPGLELPRRQAHQAADRLPRRRHHRELRVRRHRGPQAPALRHPVPSRGRPHAARQGDPRELRPRHLRLRQGLDDAQLPRRRRSTTSASRSARRSVILGLSGGVDSSVAAALLHKAIGDQLTCIFVNNGLLRAREAEVVQEVFGRNFKIKLQYEDATELFLRKLKGVTDPEKQAQDHRQGVHRRLPGRDPEARGKAKFLAQGTLYPDVIESVPIGGNPAAIIKSHHNVGGLPKNMKFELVEPLRCLFKDEVRAARPRARPAQGDRLPPALPRPRPRRARASAKSPRDKLRILRDADAIVVEEMKASGLYYKIWQTFAVLLPVRSVGVHGRRAHLRLHHRHPRRRIAGRHDRRLGPRCPTTCWRRSRSRIINEVRGVNRVVLDITSKPPGTIEWE